MPEQTVDLKPVVVTSEIEFVTERWDDPGDYPSGAGGYALPSYDYKAFDGGSYVVQFTGVQMNAIAVELDLVPSRRWYQFFCKPLTCNQIFARSGDTDKDRNEIWMDEISESLDNTDLDFDKTVTIQKQSCAYLGDGKFKVTIDEAECEYEDDGPDPDAAYEDSQDRDW